MMRSAVKMNRKGQTLLETALVLPMIGVLLLGILEFGQILMVHQSLSNAAREGARVGAISLDDTVALANAQTVTENYLTNTGVDLSITTVSPQFVDINGTSGVQVAIEHTYDSVLVGWIPGMNENFQLRSTSVMRREG